MGYNIKQNGDGSTSLHNERSNTDVLTLDINDNVRVGTYSAPIACVSDTDVLLNVHAESAGGDSGGYLYTIFSTALGAASSDNLIGIHNTCRVPAGADPKTVQAIQGHINLETATSTLATRGGDTTAGAYGAWFKVTSLVGSTCDSGSYVAPLLLDNQMYGTVSGTEYTIFSSTGGTVPDAWAGFSSTNAGWTNLLSFEDDVAPLAAGGTGDITFSGAWRKLAINVGGTTLYLVASASPS